MARVNSLRFGRAYVRRLAAGLSLLLNSLLAVRFWLLAVRLFGICRLVSNSYQRAASRQPDPELC
jgi:hypothetical protein